MIDEIPHIVGVLQNKYPHLKIAWKAPTVLVNEYKFNISGMAPEQQLDILSRWIDNIQWIR